MATALRIPEPTVDTAGIPETSKHCISCRQWKVAPTDFYPIGLNGRGQMRYRLSCRACCRERIHASNKARYEGKKAAASKIVLDPAIRLYREEKRKAGPRLAKRQRTIEAQCRRMLEALSYQPFTCGKRPATELFVERQFG